jgi:ABC-type branched-subunit amino acid transport system substrate-binding protein
MLGFPAYHARKASPLNIGVLLRVSGLQAAIGQSCKLGTDIAPAALADIGYKAPIKLLHADTETNVDRAANAEAKPVFPESEYKKA